MPLTFSVLSRIKALFSKNYRVYYVTEGVAGSLLVSETGFIEELAASNQRILLLFLWQATVAKSVVLCCVDILSPLGETLDCISSVILGCPRSLSHSHPGVGMASRLHLWCQLLLIIVIAWSAVLRRIERPHTDSEVIN